MKFGSIEGTEEEINNFFQNNGANVLDYLEKPDTPLSTIWLIVPSALLVISFGVR